MSRSGSKHLRIAGILEILLGVGSIVAIQVLLSTEGDTTVLPEMEAHNAFLGILAIYGADAFKILAGLCGICFANKKSCLTVLLGILLFGVQLLAFIKVEQDMVRIIINILLLIVPYYYLHNAIRNYRN